MDFQQKKLASQVLFWALLGPFFVTLAVLLELLKGGATRMDLSLIAIVGIPIAWKGGVRGTGLLLTLLVGVVSYAFVHTPVAERFWLVGCSLSLTLTLLIMALSFEEVKRSVLMLQQETSEHLKSSVEIDAKMEKMRKEMKAERRAWNEQLQWQQELAATARKDFVKLTKEKERIEQQLASLKEA